MTSSKPVKLSGFVTDELVWAGMSAAQSPLKEVQDMICELVGGMGERHYNPTTVCWRTVHLMACAYADGHPDATTLVDRIVAYMIAFVPRGEAQYARAIHYPQATKRWRVLRWQR